MTRGLTPAVENAAAAESAALLVAVELVFDSGIVRLCNAGQTFSFGGNDYLGIGTLGSIDVIEEGGDIVARGIKMQLSGIEPGIIATALDEDYQGRPCRVWLAFLDRDTYAVLNDPVLVFPGRMDTMSIELGETGTVTVSAESRLIDLQRPRIRRFNHEDQIAQYPNDRGLEYVHLMVSRELLWGLDK